MLKYVRRLNQKYNLMMSIMDSLTAGTRLLCQTADHQARQHHCQLHVSGFPLLFTSRRFKVERQSKVQVRWLQLLTSDHVTDTISTFRKPQFWVWFIKLKKNNLFHLRHTRRPPAVPDWGGVRVYRHQHVSSSGITILFYDQMGLSSDADTIF